MKISFNPSVSYFQAQKAENKKQVTTNPNQNHNEIQKNSMAELLGRSQTVSFGATNNIKGNIFEHVCQERRLGGFYEKDVIKYNKENGSLKHEVFDKYGDLIRSSEFFPLKNTEITTEVDEYGDTTTVTTSPEFKEVITKDSEGRTIFNDYEDYRTGYHKNIDTDMKRMRTVVRERRNSYLPESIEVYDLKTNKTVTTGALVRDTFFNENKGVEETINIITGQVLKTRQENAKGQLLRQVEYFEGEPGVVSKEINYDAKTDKYRESVFSEKRPHNLSSITITSRDNRSKQVIQYEEDGQTIKSNVLYVKNIMNKPDYTVVYNNRTNAIESQRKFYSSTYVDTFYSENPNVPCYAEEYSRKDNSLLSETYYYDDGKHIRSEKKYSSDGSCVETTYSISQKVIEEKDYDSKDRLLEVREFDEKTGYRTKTTKYNSDGTTRVTEYDSFGVRLRTVYYDKNDRPYDITEFAEDGKTKTGRKIINEDGSFTKISYDENGNETKREEFDRFGRKKTARQEQQGNWYQYQQRNAGNQGYNYQSNTQQTAGYSQRPKAETETDFLTRISGIVGQTHTVGSRVVPAFSKTDLTDADWKRLSELIGASDVESVKCMDKLTYRKLSKSFHPDLNLGKPESEQKRAEQLFRIINSIHESSK